MTALQIQLFLGSCGGFSYRRGGRVGCGDPLIHNCEGNFGLGGSVWRWVGVLNGMGMDLGVVVCCADLFWCGGICVYSGKGFGCLGGPWVCGGRSWECLSRLGGSFVLFLLVGAWHGPFTRAGARRVLGPWPGCVRGLFGLLVLCGGVWSRL